MAKFVDSYVQLKPEDQVFMALLLEALADRIRNDPEADRMQTHDLFREVIQEIAPERNDDFNRYTEGQAGRAA